MLLGDSLSSKPLYKLHIVFTLPKVEGSIPDDVNGFSNWPLILSSAIRPWVRLSHIWVPGIFLAVKGSRRVRVTITSPSVIRLYTKCGSLDVSQLLLISTACYMDSFTFFYIVNCPFLLTTSKDVLQNTRSLRVGFVTHVSNVAFHSQ
jgi:hypothetical protein